MFLGVAAAILLALVPAATSATTPAGFEEITLVSGLDQPVAVAWAPDGRIFVAEKPGRVRVVNAQGQLLAAPLLDLSDHVNAYGDRGLTGIAVDKDFAQNGFLYLAYVYEHNAANPAGSKSSRLTRVTVGLDNSVSSESVLLGSVTGVCPAPANEIDCIPAEFNTHAVGSVRVDPADGTLWVSSGDGTSRESLMLRTFDERSMAGKILHVDRNGRGLPGHPFCPTTTDLTAVCTKVFATGFRNPFRFQLRPGAPPAVGDVGEHTREEISLVRAGRNYGWPCYEGTMRRPGKESVPECAALFAAEGTASGATFPVHDCEHAAGCRAFLAGPTYTADLYPGEYRGDIFFGDYVKGDIWRLQVDASDSLLGVVPFLDDAEGFVDLAQAPNGNLVYVDIVSGAVREVRYAAGNLRPNARASASPPYGPAPLTVSFTGSQSSDPDGDALSFHWDFGDGGTSTVADPVHTYSDGTRNFVATLTVTDARGEAATAAVTISPGNTPPAIGTVDAPSTFRAGATVAASATATDAEQALPDSAYRWDVVLRHADHDHLVSGGAGPQTSFQTLDTHDADSYYEVTVTVVDARGLGSSRTVVIHPETRQFTLDSSPPGAPVVYDSLAFTAPFSKPSAIGFRTTISAGQAFTRDGRLYVFERWSDGGAQAHEIVVPAVDSTLVAHYREATGEALLVVKDAAAIGAGDAAVRARLEGLGFGVTVRSETVASSEGDGKALVFLSESASSTALNTKFRNVRSPVVVAEGQVFDDMGMTGTTSFTGTVTATSLSIVQPGHPLSAGLSGTVAVTSAPSSLVWGRPGAGATKASVVGDANKALVFGYDTGAAMPGLPAPSRRVGLFLHAATPGALTPDGWKLFDAAVTWAASAPPPTPSLTFTPAATSLAAAPGGAPVTRSASLAASDGSAAPYTLSDDAPWLTVSSAAGATPAALTLTIDPAGLAPGTHMATLTAIAPGYSAATHAVALTIGGAAGEALLVVGDASAVGAGDAALRTRLEGLGFTVVVRSQSVAATEAAGKALVYVSETTASTAIGNKFRAVAVPVLVAEGQVFDDMGMTGTTSFTGSTGGQTQVAISDPAHPLAAGLSGTVTVTTAASTFVWGRPAAGAAKASIIGDPTKAVVFGYETGAAMPGLAAPSRRVGLFLLGSVPPFLTVDGWKLFDAAVLWAASASPPPPPTPRLVVSPTATSLSVTEGAPPETRTISLTTSDSSTASYAASDDAAWLSVAPASGATPSTLTLTIDLAGLAPGSYTATVNATAASYEPVTHPVTLSVGAGTPRGEALLVVGDAGAVGAGDAALRARLEGLGFSVAVRSQSVAAAEAAGKALVYISETAASSAIGNRFRTVAVPVLLAEGQVFDDMGMTGTTSFTGTTSNQTRVSITNAAHPLAAGLSGTVTVTSAPATFVWGRPAAGAGVATIVGDGTKAVAFGYDSGAAMPGLAAPSRRVGLFLHGATPSLLTADGWRLVDAAFLWAAGAPPPAPRLAFTPGSTSASVTVGAAAVTRSVSLAASDASAASYAVSDDAPWLSAAPPSGSTPAALTLTLDPTGLAAGTYTATVTATAPGYDPATHAVTLTVGAGGGGSGFRLLVSSSPDRSAPIPLDGASLTGNAYIFADPSSGASEVRFYLDRPTTATPSKTEKTGPYDFAGTAASGLANPLAVSTLAPGGHVMRAVVVVGGVSETLTANFTAG